MSPETTPRIEQRNGAQTLLLGGILALAGAILTSGGTVLDVIGVMLLCVAVVPTAAGAVALVRGSTRRARFEQPGRGQPTG